RLSYFYSASPLYPLPSFPTRRSSDLNGFAASRLSSPQGSRSRPIGSSLARRLHHDTACTDRIPQCRRCRGPRPRNDRTGSARGRSEEHTSELQSRFDIVCRLLLAKKNFVSGAMAKAGKGLLEGTLQAGTSAVSDELLDLVGLGGKSAADKGKDTRDYLAAAFPELNAWERAGADASSAGMVDAGFENQKELTKMQLDNQKEIAEMQNETQKEIAGIQSATSRQN